MLGLIAALALSHICNWNWDHLNAVSQDAEMSRIELAILFRNRDHVSPNREERLLSELIAHTNGKKGDDLSSPVFSCFGRFSACDQDRVIPKNLLPIGKDGGAAIQIDNTLEFGDKHLARLMFIENIAGAGWTKKQSRGWKHIGSRRIAAIVDGQGDVELHRLINVKVSRLDIHLQPWAVRIVGRVSRPPVFSEGTQDKDHRGEAENETNERGFAHGFIPNGGILLRLYLVFAAFFFACAILYLLAAIRSLIVRESNAGAFYFITFLCCIFGDAFIYLILVVAR